MLAGEPTAGALQFLFSEHRPGGVAAEEEEGPAASLWWGEDIALLKQRPSASILRLWELCCYVNWTFICD